MSIGQRVVRKGHAGGFRTAILSTLFAALLACGTLTVSRAADLVWTNAGGTGKWANPLNWNPLQAPATGDSVTFGPAPLGFVHNDLALSLAALTFTSTAPEYEIRVSPSASLAFTGAGIVNDTADAGPIRQEFFADGGAANGGSGGVLAFRNTATVGGGRPSNLTALGGAADGASGGQIVFEGNSTASSLQDLVFTGLMARGAAVVGAGGGELRFKDNASMGYTAGFAVTAGEVPGGAGGLAIFEGRSVAGGFNTNNTGDGLGGRVVFKDQATTGSDIGLNNSGATTLQLGAEAVTQFLDQSMLAGTVVNLAGQGDGMEGGRVEFRQQARFDGSGLDPTLGQIQILNRGSHLVGGKGGLAVFYDDTQIVGTNVVINNGTESEGPSPGSIGGRTEFRDRARAGSVIIYNHGASGVGAIGGQTSFFGATLTDFASAESAAITNFGGHGSRANGGQTLFAGTATAGAAAITNEAGMDSGFAGVLVFQDNARAATALITNMGGDTGFNGFTIFQGDSSADSAALVNMGSTQFSLGGELHFRDRSSAGASNIVNKHGITASGWAGRTIFFGNSGAGRATILNEAGIDNGGIIDFLDSSSAQQSSIILQGSASLVPGLARFGGNSDAGEARFRIDGATGASGRGGLVQFYDSSSASRAQLLVRGGLVEGARGGQVEFVGSASAGRANLDVHGGEVADSSGGGVTFSSGTTADDASFNIDGGSGFGYLGGYGSFYDGATAGTADFMIGPGAVNFAFGGRLVFRSALVGQFATGGSANITNLGATTLGAFGASTHFEANATAGASTIVNRGAQVALVAGLPYSIGGVTYFTSNGNAGNSMITNEAGVVADATGGIAAFSIGSSAASTSITNKAAMIAGARGGQTQFSGGTAGSARIVNEGAVVAGAGRGSFAAGNVQFHAGSFAVAGQFTNQGGAANGAQGGGVYFSGNAQADVGVFTNRGGVAAGGQGGTTEFYGSSSARYGVFTNEGGAVTGAGGGATLFYESSTAGLANLYAAAGQSGGAGGDIVFAGLSDGHLATAILQGTGPNAGELDVSQITDASIGIGSIEGSGMISLGEKNLSVHGLFEDRTFSGVIRDGGIGGGTGGSLTKDGPGTLTLAGANTYTGLTTVDAGALVVTGSIEGDAHVKAGATLGGTGRVQGNVTADAGAIISPGASPGTLTVGSLSLGSASVLKFEYGVVNDLLIVEGDLVLDGVVNVAPGLAVHGFGREVFTYGGTLTDNGLEVGSVPPGFSKGDFKFDFSTPGRVGVIATPANPAKQWSQPGGSLWHTAENWDTGVVPNSTMDIARLGPAVSANSVVDLASGDATVQVLSFQNAAGSYTVAGSGGGRLTLESNSGNAAIVLENTNLHNHTISASLTLGSDLDVYVTGGMLTIIGQQNWSGRRVNVNEGLVRYAPTAAAGGTTGASLSIVRGATVELAGAASATSDGNNHVNVVNHGTLSILDVDYAVGDIGGKGATKVGILADVVVLAPSLTVDHVRQGWLTIGNGSAVNTRAGGGISVLGSLTLFGTAAAPLATLDLNDNAAVLDYSADTPAETVRQQIIAGRGGAGLGKTWNGQGITSSAAAAANASEPESRSVGFAENVSLPLGPFTSFRGQPVDDTSLLIAFTRTGDANLDGVVNDDDVTILGASYAPGVRQPHWALGDFDYNGFVDDDDVTLLGVFYDPTAAPLLTPAAVDAHSVAAVPESSAIVLAIFAACIAAIGIFVRRGATSSPAYTVINLRPGGGRSDITRGNSGTCDIPDAGGPSRVSDAGDISVAMWAQNRTNASPCRRVR